MDVQRRRFRIEGSNGSKPPEDRLDGTVLRPTVPARVTAALPDGAPIHAELAAMKTAIATMRREVARIQQNGSDHAGVHRAACELDAVVDATERATTQILGAAEDIESAASMVRAAGAGEGRREYVDTILERVVLLYETCNFQDVTGQRIRKVLTTLKFVEERLDVMLSGLGGAPGSEGTATGRPFLSGPALPTDPQNSQSDIDSYFG